MRKSRKGTVFGLAASFAIAFLCAFMVYHRTGFIYAIADDVIMRDIASGAFSGTPDGHLIFVRYALGFFLSRLYLFNGNIDWYGFFMAGSLFLGLAVILYRGLSMRRGFLWKMVYGGLVLGLFGIGLLPHAAQFEWTISAAVLGSAALYLYVTLREKENGQRQDSVLIWLLLFLTFCIRYDVFFMVMPGFGIAFLCKFVGGKKGSIQIRWKEIFLPLFVFAGVGLAALVERRAYSGPEWEEFERFQNARSEIYDYSGVPSYEANPAFFEELGLDEHEVRNLRHYALYLVEDLDADMMEALSKEAKRQAASELGTFGKMKAGLRLSLKELTDSEYFPVSLPALFFFAAILVFSLRNKKRVMIPPFLFLGSEGILWLILGYAGRLPERVAFSLHLVMMSGMAAYFFWLWCEKEEKRDQRKQKGWKQVVWPVCMLLCILGAMLQLRKTDLRNREKLAMDDNYQQFKAACKVEPEKLYFIETYMAEPVGGALVTTHGSFELNRCLTLGDWYTTSPLDKERMKALGVEHVERTILEDPNACLVVRDIEDSGFLGTYFAHKYPGTELVCKEVKNVGDRNYYLYRPEAAEDSQ